MGTEAIFLERKTMSTLNPYVKSKQKSQYARICPECGTGFVTNLPNKICCKRSCTEAQWRKKNPESVRLISDKTVRALEGFRDPAPHVCDTSRFGYCVPCRLREIREGRGKKVMLTDEATRTRTRNNYRKHQPAARAGAGD
jgi:hypothetical protein